MNPREFAAQFPVFRCKAGSHAYGMAGPESDVDTRGVFIAPPDYVLSAVRSIEQIENFYGDDDVMYELKKFIKLAAANNPNIIELLYIGDDDVILLEPEFDILRSNRHLFLSKKAKHAFSGYAASQLKRIRGHAKWLENPQPVEPPRLPDFCQFIDLSGVVHKSVNLLQTLAIARFLVPTFAHTVFRVYMPRDVQKHIGLCGFFNHDETDVQFITDKDNGDDLRLWAEHEGTLIVDFECFRRARKNWTGYWDWKKNRNPQRAILEEKHNYDCKHASHLVRLLSTCKEILSNSEVLVRRPDAEWLLEIRNGKFDYTELMDWVKQAEEEIEELYETSDLQNSADHTAIDNLYRKIVLKYWEKKGLLAQS